MVDLLGWWYSHGWSWVITHTIFERNKKILAALSFKDMVRTWFAPYRQTFAGSVKGGLGDKIRGLIDQLVSRTVGFIVRSLLIFSAFLAVCFNTVISILVVLFWPVIPALPLIAVVLIMAGLNNAV